MSIFDFTKVVDALKLSPKILLGVAMASGVALFAPLRFLKQLGLETLVAFARGWIGAAFLLSAVMLIAHALAKPAARSEARIGQWFLLRRSRKSLVHLSPQERRVVKDFVARKETTRIYPISDGVVEGLVRKSVLYRPTSLAVHGEWFSYNIQTWVYNEVEKRPHLLDGAADPEEEYERD